MKKLLLFLHVFCCSCFMVFSTTVSTCRERINFGDCWRFHNGDEPEAVDANFEDTGWQLLDLPHDWAIEGNFSKDNPSGTGGGALPGGIGWDISTNEVFDMELNYNRVHLCGQAEGVPALSHVNHGCAFYKFTLAVMRLSG